MRSVGLILACFVACQVACSDSRTPTVREEARTDGFVLMSEDLDQWSAFLKQRKDFRRQLKNAEDQGEEVARTAAVTAILLRDHGDLISDIERRSPWRDLADRAIRSTYVREVLGPEVVVESTEVREIFETHREGYSKARGAKVLEIFLWAPEDLVDLRAEKRAMLEEIRMSVSTPEDFRAAAQEVSDATSAIRGGSIGTVLEDQVQGAIQETLFTEHEGLTGIVENNVGLYLFWVVGRVEAKENALEDVADTIEAKLRRQKLRALIAGDLEKLRSRHSFTLLGNGPPQRSGAPVLELDGEVFTLDDLDLTTWNRKAIESRAMAMLFSGVLRERSIQVNQPDAFEYDWLMSRRILERLVAQAPDTLSRPDGFPIEEDGRSLRKTERWTFDLLTIEGVRSPEALFEVFRAQHNLGGNASLEMLQVEMETVGIHATITPFDDVLASSVGRLGPEIHTTIKKRLGEGEMSRPMHLADRGQVVVVVLEDRRVDEQAGGALTASARKRRSRKRAEARVVDELLLVNGFQMVR